MNFIILSLLIIYRGVSMMQSSKRPIYTEHRAINLTGNGNGLDVNKQSMSNKRGLL